MAIGHFLGLTVISWSLYWSLLVSTVSNSLDDQLTISVAEFPTSSHGVFELYLIDPNSINI